MIAELRCAAHGLYATIRCFPCGLGENNNTFAAAQHGVSSDPGALLVAAVEASILAPVNQLMHGSEILESPVQASGLAIMGAQYSRATGEVTFYQ